MSILNIPLLSRSKDFPKLSLFASWPGAMISPQRLELPLSRTNFHRPEDVRAIEDLLQIFWHLNFYQISCEILTSPFLSCPHSVINPNNEYPHSSRYATTSEKGPYAICEQRSRCACTFLQSDLDIFCLSTFTIMHIVSINGQQRHWSACANAQADLGLCFPHTA